MSKKLQLRGGTTTEHASFTGAVREVTVDTDKDTLVIHDGSTAGGFPLPRTDAEIRTAVEAATDSNVFTDADHTKLNAIEAAATADQTKADIDALNINADLLDGQHGAYYTGYTDTAVAGIVDSSPAALNTLNELAAALGDDANFATNVTNSIGTKMPEAGGAFTGNVTFGDNNKIVMGSGSDLQIWHDGSNSYIKDHDAGNLFIQGSTTVTIEDVSGNNMAVFNDGGSVDLYHGATTRIATTSSGITVTGIVTTGGSSYQDGAITDTGTFTVDVAGVIILDADADGTIELKDAGAKYGVFYKSSSHFMVYNPISNGDIRLTGNDGGSVITALTLDMSAAGAAIFNNSVTATSFSGDGSSLTGVGASTTYGAVGTYLFGRRAGSLSAQAAFNAGSTYSGSTLYPAGLSNYESSTNLTWDQSGKVYFGNASSAALSGTWRAMGTTTSSSSNLEGPVTLFVRIS